MDEWVEEVAVPVDNNTPAAKLKFAGFKSGLKYDVQIYISVRLC